jgi:hypothetical protein
MTPNLANVENARPDNTPVRLANHSVVSSPHKGLLGLLLDTDVKILSLVVPDLAKPLISIANLCDTSLTVVFTSGGCNIYNANTTTINGTVVAHSHRRGIFYYLPQGHVSSKSALNHPAGHIDNSLLGYHTCLSHIGL